MVSPEDRATLGSATELRISAAYKKRVFAALRMTKTSLLIVLRYKESGELSGTRA